LANTKAISRTSTGGQVAKFGAVGILNTLVDYVIYIGLTKVFSIPLERVWVAKLISGTVAIINSYYFKRTWVFNRSDTKNSSQQLFRFIVSTVIAVYVIQLGLVQVFTTVLPQFGQFAYSVLQSLGLTEIFNHVLTEAFVIKTVAFGLATAASMTWNFVLYKLWAFKE
jgi:putative flippase GtrA